MRLPLLMVLLGLLFGGCDKPPPQTGKGFYLPAGNAQRGQAAFVQLNCHVCHTVAGVQLPAPLNPAPKIIHLGGEVTRVRSYGDLVTSIIYPAHSVSDLLTPAARKAGEPSMPEVAKDITVAQLVDIVTFLQPHYKAVTPAYNYGYPTVP